MKKLIYLFLALTILACGSDSNQVYIDKVKQQVNKDAMGVEMKYKNVSFEWVDTLTVKKQLALTNTQYDEGISAILSSFYFSEETLTKKELTKLKNWENGIRDTPFKFGGKKYKNFEEFALANRDASSFIAEYSNQIDISNELIKNWDNLGKGNLELIKNANWYYQRKANYNGTSESVFNSITKLVESLEELQVEIATLSDLNQNDIIEIKALNNYKINNPLLGGAEVDVTKYFIFDKDYNIVRTEGVD
tara:strand:- start:277 stop:1023 length:747 start_codon:yes stop_codon:yes gene_type:complete